MQEIRHYSGTYEQMKLQVHDTYPMPHLFQSADNSSPCNHFLSTFLGILTPLPMNQCQVIIRSLSSSLNFFIIISCYLDVSFSLGFSKLSKLVKLCLHSFVNTSPFLLIIDHIDLSLFILLA